MLKSTPFFPQCMSAWLNTIKFTVIITSYFFPYHSQSFNQLND